MAVSRRGIEEVAVDPVPFGRYVLLDRIAEGRIGTVHRACLSGDDGSDTLLAIKCISPQLSRDPGFAEQFNAVMSRAAELEHSAHCGIAEVGCAVDGSLYLAMELVAGKNLGRIGDALHERGVVMPATLLAYVGSRIAAVLAAAHAMTHAGKAAPLYHGELAPTDILIGYDGAVCLTGLGSAALQAASPDPTPRYGYRAPELERGICNAQSDVFSLGACLSELLTGRSASAARVEIRGESRRPESHITRVVPRPLEQIVRRALQEDPAARWQSAADLGHALEHWCSTQTTPADAAGLAEFMHTLFDAAHKVETKRLQVGLARLASMSGTAPAPRGSASSSHAAPTSRANYPQLVRASENARSRAPARTSAARVDQNKPAASAAKPRDAKHASWTDASEQTPAREGLMQELAAEMAGGDRSEHPTLEKVLDNPWDDDSPAERWISEGEERESLEWRMSPRKPASAPVTPAPLVMPARTAHAQPPAPLPMSAPVWPARSTRPLVPVLAGAALIALIAAFALLRNTGSTPNADHVQATAPVQTSAKTSPEPVTAAAVAVPNLQNQPAATAVAVKTAPPSARAFNEGDSDRGRARHHRATSERSATDSEPASPEATNEAADDVASSAPAFSAPTPRRELASAGSGTAPASESAAVAPIRARPESIGGTAPALTPSGIAERVRGGASFAATTPATEPPARAVAPARTAPAAPAPRPTAVPESRGPSRAATLIERTTPRLSARARRIGITEGVATIELTIDPSGAVTNASVVKADPANIFEGSALNAFREWRYQPALSNGTAVESRQRVTIRFAE